MSIQLILLILLFSTVDAVDMKSKLEKATEQHLFPRDRLWKDLADVSLDSKLSVSRESAAMWKSPHVGENRDYVPTNVKMNIRYVYVTWEAIYAGVFIWIRAYMVPFVLIITSENDSCSLDDDEEMMSSIISFKNLVQIFTTCTKSSKYDDIISLPLGVLNDFSTVQIASLLVEKLFLDVSIFERYPEHEKTFDTIVLTDDRSFHHDEYNILRAARYLIVSKRHVWFSKDENDDVLSSVPSYSVEDPPFEFRGDAYRSGDDDTEFVVLSLFEEGR